MTQTTDIVLDGAGYMILPGTYRRQTDGVAEGTPGTWMQRDFVGGQRRAIQLEAERGWDSEGVGPALLGQGVEPWPYGTDHSDSVIATPSASTPQPSMLLADRIYIGIGRYLYQSISVTTTTWSNFTQVADLGAGVTITSLAQYGDKLAIACGVSRDIAVFNHTTGAVSTLQAGEQGDSIVGYANELIWSDVTAGNTGRLRLTTGAGIDTRHLDSAIARMTLHGGKLAIATKSSIYLLGGHADPTAGVWIGDPEPTFTQGIWTDPSDFAVLISFAGKLYAWLAKGLMEWNPNAGNTRQGWRSVGIEGVDIFGATVAAGWLIVSLRAHDGSGQVWAYDGAGWWMIENGIARLWPVAISGAGTFDLLAFRHGATTYDLYRLIHRDTVANAYRTSGAWRSSLIDAMAPNELKRWRSFRAFFAAPEDRGNTASADYVTVELRYSTDGGRTWQPHASDSIGGTVSRVYDLGGLLTAPGPTSRYLQVEVRWSSIVDWAPTLTAVSLDYERLGTDNRRRRWQMTIEARDRQVDRTGGQMSDSVAAIVSSLWASWSSGAPLAFRDIDYDIDSIERTVRVVSLLESRPESFRLEATAPISVALVEI